MTTTASTAKRALETKKSRIVLIVDRRSELAKAVKERLGESLRRDVYEANIFRQPLDDLERELTARDVECVVFSPLLEDGSEEKPDLDYASKVFRACRAANVRRLVLLSSAEVYGAHFANPGLIREQNQTVLKEPNAVSEAFAEIERQALEAFDETTEVVVLRPCSVLFREGNDFASRLFRSRFPLRLAGFDPTIQLLSVDDLASVVAATVEAKTCDGVFNVAPDEAIPLRKALKATARFQIALPTWLLDRTKSTWKRAKNCFIRYTWTVSNRKLKERFDITLMSSAQVVQAFAQQPQADSVESHDAFGMDRAYIQSCGKWQLGFMEKAYWRIDSSGWENVPKQGGGVLCGIHRGFMPFDGVMMVHMLAKYARRVPRFLIHPALAKPAHLSGFLSRLGGIIACQENADVALEREELLAVFPEGIRGAFRKYDDDIYKLGKFSDDYVRVAIRHGVPILPFVIVGQAETFPILKKIDWKWWKRTTHWPCFPITLTWPFLPAPLPSKWHVRMLEPIATIGLSPEDAEDRKIVRELSLRARTEMQAAIDGLLANRPSVFWGSAHERACFESADIASRSSAVG